MWWEYLGVENGLFCAGAKGTQNLPTSKPGWKIKSPNTWRSSSNSTGDNAQIIPTETPRCKCNKAHMRAIHCYWRCCKSLLHFATAAAYSDTSEKKLGIPWEASAKVHQTAKSMHARHFHGSTTSKRGSYVIIIITREMDTQALRIPMDWLNLNWSCLNKWILLSVPSSSKALPMTLNPQMELVSATSN